METLFRRDAHLKPGPGTIVAEFTNGQDAMRFCELKGSGYTITPGINHVFAVRVAAIESSASSVGCADRSPAAPSLVGAAGGFQLIPFTERWQQFMESL